MCHAAYLTTKGYTEGFFKNEGLKGDVSFVQTQKSKTCFDQKIFQNVSGLFRKLYYLAQIMLFILVA